jgi:predicted branched-subunit amino acid permease
MTRKESFIAGVIDSGPICVAFLFLGLSFGAISHSYAISFWQTLVMAAFIYAMPLQVVLVDMLKHGSTLLAVAVTAIVVNFRFSLMTASLLSHFKKTRAWKILLSLPLLSASSFTVTHVTLGNSPKSTTLDSFWYYLGVAGTGFFVSLVFTVLGFCVSGIERSFFLLNVLTMILPIHFTALTAMRWPKFRFIFATLLGFLLMPLGKWISSDYALIWAPMAVGLLFTIFHKKEKKK